MTVKYKIIAKLFLKVQKLQHFLGGAILHVKVVPSGEDDIKLLLNLIKFPDRRQLGTYFVEAEVVLPSFFCAGFLLMH